MRVLDDDWQSGVDTASRLYYLKSVQFIPGAVSDRLIIRNGGVGKCEVFDSGVCQAEGQAVYEKMDDDVQIAPFIDISECICSAGSKLIMKWKYHADL